VRCRGEAPSPREGYIPDVMATPNEPRRILVADDEEPLREAMREILADAGYQVTTVPDGDGLLRAYRANPFDLVLCDLYMPGKEGLETIRELCREFAGVRIIAVSGGGHLGSADMLELARLLGAVEVLRKPLKRAALLESVARVLAA
jgi:CheY-like chemotaxis protein